MNNNFTVSGFCRLFCCPPRPSRVVAKFAFLPPPVSYSIKVPSKPTQQSASCSSAFSSFYAAGQPKSTKPSPEPDYCHDGIRVRAASLDEGLESVAACASGAEGEVWGSGAAVGGGGGGGGVHRWRHASNSKAKTPTEPAASIPNFLSAVNNRQVTANSQKDDPLWNEMWQMALTNDWPVQVEIIDKIQVFFVQSRSHSRIACLYIPTECRDPSLYTILFSHGNAVDIGQMACFLASLSQAFGISVFCYDYSGYGLSTGRPLESNLYADAEAVLEAVQSRFNFPLNRIILYGQSIGTAPTVHLAARYKVAGVVLHSALMSGIRVVCPGTTHKFCFDPFTNIDKIDRVASPTLVIHGDADEIIAVEHGYQLYQRLSNPVDPIWVKDAGHNDVESYPEYAERLSKFLREELPAHWRQQQQQQEEPAELSGDNQRSANKSWKGGAGGNRLSNKLRCRGVAAAASNSSPLPPPPKSAHSRSTSPGGARPGETEPILPATRPLSNGFTGLTGAHKTAA